MSTKLENHNTQSKFINTFRDIAENHDGFIIDLWGVIHDGINAYPGTVDCINHLISSENKTVIFMSNAPRPKEVVLEKLRNLQINVTAEMIITSGDTVRILLEKDIQDDGKKYYHLGSNRNSDLLSGMQLNLVDDITETNVLLLSAYMDPDENFDQYDSLLRQAVSLNIPAICANPDKEVINGNSIRYCAGILGEKYELFGGSVYYYGKPHLDIYNVALQRFRDRGISNNKRIVMIGDTLETDIQGAQNANINSALVLTGNMENLLKNNKFKTLSQTEALKKIFSEYQLQPTYVLESLS